MIVYINFQEKNSFIGIFDYDKIDYSLFVVKFWNNFPIVDYSINQFSQTAKHSQPST